MSERRVVLIVMLGLLAAVAACYYPILGNGFVNYDDGSYVTDNPHVQAGLTLRGLLWAFNVGYVSNWHPLTWLWHMLEFELLGMSAAGHHLVSLLMHMGNTLLLFAALRRLTAATWPSAFVAALFAVHPLNVESVAWVSEQKNLLSTTFWLATMWAYAGYVDRPGVRRYMPVALLLALGLMAKPMLVTLPCVLLLLDYWPLNRFGRNGGGDPGRVARLVAEKLPLFALVVASCAVTYVAQGEARGALDQLPVPTRLANAAAAYLSYLERALWPAGLAVHYPHPGAALGAGRVAAAVAVLAAVSLVVAWRHRRQPYLVTGWLWYLGTLVPVIGLVQVGTQASADRYAYVPLIGVFIMIAWSIPDLAPRQRRRNAILAAAAGCIVAALGVRTWQQTRHWRDSLTLFEHTLAVTSDNPLANNNLAHALVAAGRTSEARAHYEQALRLGPADARLERRIRTNLAVVLARQGEHEQSIEIYEQLHRDDPEDVDVLINLGVALAGQGRHERALELLEEAGRLAPDRAEVPYNLGLMYAASGQLPRASDCFRRGLELAPDDKRILNGLGITLAQRGMLDQAIVHLQEAVRIDPDYAAARRNLALVRSWKAQRDGAPR